MKENTILTDKGFITIATGDEWYYEIALNLLKSYRRFSNNPLPFAIICDKQNKFTDEFDVVIESPRTTSSYMDKLLLGELSPFAETIFLDADCLAYSDLNVLFEIFANADDVSCLGKIEALTLESTGWFSLNSFPVEKAEGIIDRNTAKTLPYSVGLHGGMYYIRSTSLAKKVFLNAMQLAGDYSYYKFPVFAEPADEPVIALAMAINRCKPIPYSEYALSCFWNTPLKLNLYKQKAYRKNGTRVPLTHFGTRYTKTPLYGQQVAQLECLLKNDSLFKIALVNFIYKFKIGKYNLMKTKGQFIERISGIKVLKKLWHIFKRYKSTWIKS